MEVDAILDEDSLDIEILEVITDKKTIPEKDVIKSKNEVKEINPIKNNSMNTLHSVLKRIDSTKNEIKMIENTIEETLRNFASQAAYRKESSSDSESDLYSNTGEPIIIKKRKNTRYKSLKVVEIEDTWQRVIDDKWIIGFILQNNVSCKLKRPTIYVCMKDRTDKHHGVSIFWTLADDSHWHPTKVIEVGEQFIATAIVDLPIFDDKNYVEVHGTIFCEFDDKVFQRPIPSVTLSVENVVDGSCKLDLDCDEVDEVQLSILALKAVSVERLIILPVQPDSGFSARVMNFLEKYEFTEICKVCVARSAGSLQHCVLEVLPMDKDEAEVKVLISARSEAQLSVIIQLLRNDFPDLEDVTEQQILDEAAAALLKELNLYFTDPDRAEIQAARTKTDLLIP